MGNDKKIEKNRQELFDLYRDEISNACERAVRAALLKHKTSGHPIAVSRDGKVVILDADEIEIT